MNEIVKNRFHSLPSSSHGRKYRRNALVAWRYGVMRHAGCLLACGRLTVNEIEVIPPRPWRRKTRTRPLMCIPENPYRCWVVFFINSHRGRRQKLFMCLDPFLFHQAGAAELLDEGERF